jgi:hypothetical protein
MATRAASDLALICYVVLKKARAGDMYNWSRSFIVAVPLALASVAAEAQVNGPIEWGKEPTSVEQCVQDLRSALETFFYYSAEVGCMPKARDLDMLQVLQKPPTNLRLDQCVAQLREVRATVQVFKGASDACDRDVTKCAVPHC